MDLQPFTGSLHSFHLPARKRRVIIYAGQFGKNTFKLRNHLTRKSALKRPGRSKDCVALRQLVPSFPRPFLDTAFKINK